MTSNTLRLAASLLFCLTALCHVALSQTVEPPTTGMPQYGSFSSGFDKIDLGNLNIHFEIPLYHKDGRGIPFDYKLVYDSSVWKGEGTQSTGSWSPANPHEYGWSFQISGWENVSGTFDGTSEVCPGSDPAKYSASAAGFSITTPDGVKRAFTGTTSYNGCPNTPTYTPLTASNGGYLLSVQVTGNVIGALVSGNLTDPSGHVFSLLGTGNQISFIQVGTGHALSDTNGNAISLSYGGGNYTCPAGSSPQPVYSDTLGVTPVSVASGSILGNDTIVSPGCAPSVLNYTDANGNTQTITITYQPFTIATNYGLSGMAEYGPSRQLETYLITGITYPDGTGYYFTYEPTPPGVSACTVQNPCTTGRIASVTLPSGGTIAYSYTGGSNGIFFDGSTAGFTRTTSDGTTTYARSGMTSTNGTGSSATTITSADSYQSQTVIQFMESTYDFYETSRKLYSGPQSGGNLKRTISTCYYTGSTSSCGGGTPAMPFTEIDVTQTLDNNQTSKTVTRYNSYQLPTEADAYDYGNGSPGSLLSKTLTVYNASLGNNILNRPQTVTVQDGSGNQVSQTTYTYDQSPSPVASTPASPPGWFGWTGSRGNATSVSQWINTTGGTLTTSMVYDTAGQIVQSIDPSNNTTSIAYDSTYDAFPVTVTPPTPSSGVALSATASYDPNTGLMFWVQDANLQKTSFTYDSMLRLATTTNPDTAVMNSTYIPVLSGTYTGHSQAGVNILPGGSASKVDTESFYDGYGRLVRTATANGQTSNPWYIQDVCYDADGRVSGESLPYQASSYTGAAVCPGSGTYSGDIYTYDGIGRSYQITHADGSSVTYAYAGRATYIEDEGSGNNSYAQTISQYDGLGRLSIVCEVGPTVLASASGNAVACGLDYIGSPTLNGYLTSYSYSLANHTTTTTQGVQARVFTTDSLGRTVQIQEPEVSVGNQQGLTKFSYAYNSTGLAVTRTRPAANQTGTALTTTVTQFDQVGRPLSVTYNDKLTPNLTYAYDTGGPGDCGTTYNAGRLVSQSTAPQSGSSSGGSTADIYCYDLEGRIFWQWQATCTTASCSGSSYVQGYQYDLADNLISASDPASATYTYTVSPAAEITKITSSLSGTNYPPTLLSVNAIGPQGPSQVTLGNGVVGGYNFDARQRLSGMTLTGGGSTFYSYGSQLAGNGAVKSETDTANGNWTYTYDANNRLSTSAEASPATAYSYSYDRWGNRWNQTLTQGTGNNASFLFNNATNQITTSGYSYDAAGERTRDPNHSYTYDAEGRVLLVDGGSTATYTYDADGNRVESTTTAGTLDSVYNLDGQVSAVINAITLAAVRENAWWGSNKLSFYSGGTTYFVHQTPLGTVRGLTSATGGIYFYDTMNPFGDGVVRYDNSDPDTLLFAGLDFDKESGLDHAWARQYSSTEGVWTTPDPYNGSYDPNNPQSFNRYAYVLNNPLMFVDPSGLDLGDPSDGFNNGPGDDIGDQGWYGAPDPDDGLGLGDNHNGGYGDTGGIMGTTAFSGTGATPDSGNSGNPQAQPPGPSGNPNPPAPGGGGIFDNNNSGGTPGQGAYHGPTMASLVHALASAYRFMNANTTCNGSVCAQFASAPLFPEFEEEELAAETPRLVVRAQHLAHAMRTEVGHNTPLGTAEEIKKAIQVSLDAGTYVLGETQIVTGTATIQGVLHEFKGFMTGDLQVLFSNIYRVPR